ncbi:MAG TPA: hypothetical protein VFG15_16925 [Amycolatopsis sp.]|nr:hypothetical protein [Amycolatopsis sp.]
MPTAKSTGMKLVPVFALVLGLVTGALWLRSTLPACSEVYRGEGRYYEVCRESLP